MDVLKEGKLWWGVQRLLWALEQHCVLPEEKWPWGSWWAPGGTGGSHVPLTLKGLVVFWAAWGRAGPAGRGR